jgi:hypothetical protein
MIKEFQPVFMEISMLISQWEEKLATLPGDVKRFFPAFQTTFK